MLKNKKFGRYAITFCILGIVFMFLYSGLENDQINIIQGFSGWNSDITVLPITIGNLVCIPLTLVYGTLFIKLGVKKTLLPCILLSALGCLGIASANGIASVSGVELASASAGDIGIYPLYAVSLFIIRCTCMCLQMAGFQLAASWFIRYRGRVLGIITLGSPLFSVIGTSVMSNFIQTKLGGDYRPFYIGLCVLLVVMAVLVSLLIKDSPESAGLYPDGLDTPPKSEEGVEEVNLTIGQVLSQKKSWIMIVNFGIYQFIIGCCMASMVVWFTHLALTYMDSIISLGGADLIAASMGMPSGEVAVEELGPMILFVGQASKWLSIGAILGIPMSFVFGVIDDKLGTPVAAMTLGVTEFLPVIGLMMQKNAVATTGACSVPWLVLWGFGVACMTGGVPTMHPASISFAFGRREYQAANRIIMAIQLVPCAFSAQIMMKLIKSSNDMSGWIMCLVLVAIGILFTIPMFKMTDPNAADRG